MVRAADPIRVFAEALSEAGGLKLWSVLVTILGDLAQGGVKEVPGTVLTGVVERIGLQATAMRVALHRLKRDGWVESRHAARVGYYSLSATGFAQTQAVHARVYEPSPPPPDRYALSILPPAQKDAWDAVPDDLEALPLGRGALIFHEGAVAVPDDWMLCRLEAMSRPEWVETALAEAACESGFAELLDMLGGVDARGIGDAREQLAMRMLVLHGWRRLVLRSNPVAEAILGETSSAHRCRLRVLSILADCPRPDLRDVLMAEGE